MPRLVPLEASALATPGLETQLRLVALLRRALRAERMRGIGGHWTYDLVRHAALLAAYREERARAALMLQERRKQAAAGRPWREPE